ncbi:MAG: T9SS type A sorting domain-containing protein, partial [Ignavibacteriota bacterium]
AFSSVSITKGTLLTAGTISVSQDTSHIAVQFSKADTTKAGELLKLSFKAKYRADTICTTILNPRLAILNDDNLVSLVEFNLGGICILGIDTVVKGIVGSHGEPIKRMSVYPNPANTNIDFSLPLGSASKKHLIVTDALGRIVLETVLETDFHWEIAGLPDGFYTAILSDISSLKSGRAISEAHKILIVH